MRGTRLFSALTLTVIIVAQFVVGAVGVLRSPQVAHAEDPDCALSGNLVIKELSFSVKEVAEGVQVKMSAKHNTVTNGGDGGPVQSINVKLYRKVFTDPWVLYKQGDTSGNHTDIAVTASGDTSSFTFLDPKVDKAEDVSRGVYGGTTGGDFTYKLWIMQNNYEQNPRCSSEEFIKFRGNSTDHGTNPPCPTNIQIKDPKDIPAGGEVDLKWDFTWANQPAGATIKYKAEINGKLPNDDTVNTYTSKQGTVKGLVYTGTGENKVRILAFNGTETSVETCKPVLLVLTAGGISSFTDQSGKQTFVTPNRVDNNECGSSSGLFNIVGALKTGICSMVVVARDFGQYLTKSSMGLLITTAGLPLDGKISEDKLLFDGLKGSAFSGRIEENLVDNNAGAVARNAYGRVLNIVNALVLILLIVIALANILQIQVNIYSFKKLLPGLVIGLILANATFFIVRGLAEISGYAATAFIPVSEVKAKDKDGKPVGPKKLLDQFVGFGSVVGPGREYETFVSDKSSTEPNMSLVFQQGFMNIFLFIAAIMLLILGFLFAIRSLIFYVLVPLGPLAFIGLYYPPMNAIWKRWWAMIFNWTFMPVVAFFWLWLGFNWMASIPADGTTGFFAYMINYCFGIAMIYLAMKTPFTMAGEAKTYLDKWNGLGKSAWKKTGGAGLEWTGKTLGREAKTFANNKNLLGIPALRTAWKRNDAAAEERLKNSQEQLKSRGKLNKNATRREERNKAEKENIDERMDELRTETQLHDNYYKDLKARTAAMKEGTHELEEILKNDIRIRKDSDEKLKDLRMQSDELKKDAILTKRDADAAETRRIQDFEDTFDEKKIMAPYEKAINDKTITKEQQAELNLKLKRARDVKQARILSDAYGKVQEKVRSDSGRAAVVSLQQELNDEKFVADLLKEGSKTTVDPTTGVEVNSVQDHQVHLLSDTLATIAETARKNGNTTLATDYLELKKEADLAKGLNDVDRAAKFAELKAKMETVDGKKDKLETQLRSMLPVRIAIEEGKVLTERAEDIFDKGLIKENVDDLWEAKEAKGKRSIIDGYIDVLAGRGSSINVNDDEHLQTLGAIARAVQGNYKAVDIEAFARLKKAVEAKVGTAPTEAKEIAAKQALELADTRLKEHVQKLIDAAEKAAIPKSKGGKGNNQPMKKLKEMGIDSSVDSVDKLLEMMQNTVDDIQKKNLRALFEDSRATESLYVDKTIATRPGDARKPRSKK